MLGVVVVVAEEGQHQLKDEGAVVAVVALMFNDYLKPLV